MDSSAKASKLKSVTQFIFLSLEEIISQHKAIVYKTTNKEVGEKAQLIVPERPVLHGCSF